MLVKQNMRFTYLFSGGISSEKGSKNCVVNYGHLLCFRWLELHVEPRKVSGQNLVEVMARQTELLNQLVQAQMSQFHHQSRGRDEHPSTGYQDFLSTQPPLFHKADEPLDADAWLRTIESEFALLSTPCSDANKALFATQQLRGTARIWWDHYYAMQPAGHVVTWDEFRTTFRAHHTPKGLIERKLNEFLTLTQGTRTVMQYA
jgi:hypothetical protein